VGIIIFRNRFLLADLGDIVPEVTFDALACFTEADHGV
jgi:hypothetical protein